MNCFMGARDPQLGAIPSTAESYVPFYAKYPEIPRPDQLWVLLDEDERSINDGFFVTDPTGQIWFDFPAISAHRHNYSYALNFADGHSEIWRYHDTRTWQVTMNKTEQPGNVDLATIGERDRHAEVIDRFPRAETAALKSEAGNSSHLTCPD